ncbi:MAG: dTDP-4-dehydrorhamnose reductase [Spirochaetia bacterium]|nr:dTDP-4-dehydrorhamnose reductase [Spirochaetia bacterium]
MIWITGARGMLGRELYRYLEKQGIPCVGSGKEVDILDPDALKAFVCHKDIDWVVNCAAYTDVDGAEEEESLAFRLNAAGPENLARLCAETGSRFIHISSDYVFDGSGSRPYLETDPVSPMGAYARSKAEGERRVMAACPEAIILRTAWLYGRYGNNFVYTMVRLMNEVPQIGVVADQKACPTWSRDLAETIAALLQKPGVPAGLYHIAGSGETSWYGFAQEIYRCGRELGLISKTCALHALKTAEYPTKAIRPAYSVLDMNKIALLGLTTPAWTDSLRVFLEEECKNPHACLLA